MNLAVFTEADFFSVFHLNYSKDRIRVVEYIGDEQRQVLNIDLPEYHSLWYDVGHNELTPLSPVPAEAEIVASFEGRNSAPAKRKVAV